MKNNGIQLALHMSAFVLSLLLVISISLDTFRGVAFYEDTNYLDMQFWICVLLLVLFVLEVLNADRPLHYLKRNFLFLLLIIPYLTLFDWMNIPLAPETEFVFRFIPLIRGYIAFTVIAYWLMKDWAAGLLITYVVVLFSFIYYCSLIFYVLEGQVNPLVHDFWDCIWFSCMTATTVGTNITAVTTVGRVISVALAAAGMMLLPVFTVYLTDLIRNGRIGEHDKDNDSVS